MMKKTTRQFIAALTTPVLCIAITVSAAPSVSAKEAAPVTVTGDLFKITTKDDFSKGTLNNLVIDTTAGDGAVKLKPGATEGEFISNVFSVAAFQTMVASWNSDTPEGTYIEVYARAYVDCHSAWTEWLSWGQWNQYIQRGSADYRKNSGTYAYVDTDTFTIRGNSGESASKIQLKAVLHTDDASATPILRQLAATYRNTEKGKEIKPVSSGNENLPARVLLDTPAYSQMVRDSSISSSICSPTTITTLLNDRGNDLLPEEVALNCYDFVYQGFGNWSFSLAAAGAYGYESYVQYADMDILREELANGYSVGISVQYTNVKSGDEAYVEGAPVSTTGHLITVRGYEKVNGVDYFYVSDSAAGSDQTSLLRYRADQLDAAWKGRIAYIVHKKEANAGQYATQRIKAELTAVNGNANDYMLLADGKQIKLTSDFLGNAIAAAGGGIIACCLNDSVIPAVAKPTVTTTANHEFNYYATVTADGNLHLDPEKIIPNEKNGKRASVTVYVITNSGKVYIAPLTLIKNSGAAAVQTVAQDQAPAAGKKGGIKSVLPYIVMGGALIIAAASACLIIRKRKKKN